MVDDAVIFWRETVVAAVDGSPESDRALRWAVEQALVEGRELALVHALAPNTASSSSTPGAAAPKKWHSLGHRERGREVLARASLQVSALAPGVRFREVLRRGDPGKVLAELSASAYMLVLGSRPREPIRTLLFGSTSIAAVRHAQCPVVVHRRGVRDVSTRRVVVGADATSDSAPVLDFAFKQAALMDLQLTAVHLWAFRESAVTGLTAEGTTLEHQRLALAESIAGFAEQYPDVVVRRVLHGGMPGGRLLEYAENMDLLVVGRHQRTPAQEFMFGAASEWLIKHAPCPVAVVPLGPLTKATR
jgi:nucleotide-binding universal stress UspA family protein